MILTIILFICFLTLACFLFYRQTSSYRGKKGESHIHDVLMDLPNEYTILDDVVLYTNNGTTQIDHIVVSKYGVFAIETKNYTGEIYGNDQNEEWKQIIVTRVRYRRNPFKVYTYVTKNLFYNPVKQSLGHSYVIKDKLKSWKYLPVVPIVCFTGNCNISSVKSKHNVVYWTDLLSVIYSHKTVYLNDDEVKEIAQLLSDYNMRSEVSNKEHIKNIKNIKNIKRDIGDKIESGICPKCGGKLIKREGKFGNFLGCRNYPKCKFTRNI